MSSSGSNPKPAEQLQEIEELVKQEKKVDSKWYLIPASWYKDFIEYCNDPSMNFQPKVFFLQGIYINSQLTPMKCLIGRKSHKVEFIPEEAYKLLVKWYKLKEGCKEFFRYVTYTTAEHTDVGIEVNVIVKKDHKMGRVNREIQIKFGSEENDIKEQLMSQLNLSDKNFKLLYRQDRTEEFREVNDFIANDDHDEIKEILVLYQGSKEEEEEFIKEFNKSGRIDGEYYDIRIGNGFWVQGKVIKFGNNTLSYDLMVINKSQNNDIWSSCYDNVIRPLNYYTPNFRDFRKGDVVAKKVLSEYKTFSILEVDFKNKKIKYFDNSFKFEDIENDTLYDNEAYQIFKYNKNNVLGRKSSSTNSIRPTTQTNITSHSSSSSNNNNSRVKDNNTTSIYTSSSSGSSGSSYSTRNYYSHYNSEPPAPGVVGLSNIGNTCFMDSMLQCMSNCQPLTEYFLSGNYIKDINETNPIGTKGELARSYANLLENLWNGHSSVFTPSDFKHTIGRHAPRFAGYEQQDSSELMNYLLDGLHEDLNKIKNKPYIEGVNTEGKSLEEAANEYWKVHLARNTSKIVDIFCAQLRSHLVCPNCNNASDIFDPYYSLSLPIPDRITYKVDALYYCDFNQPPLRLTITANNEELEDFEIALRNQLNIPESDKIFNANYSSGEVTGNPLRYSYYRRDNEYCYFNLTEITKRFNNYCQSLDPSLINQSGLNDDITEANNNNYHRNNDFNHNNINYSSEEEDSPADNNSFSHNNNHNNNSHHNRNNNSEEDEYKKFTFVNFKIDSNDYRRNKYYYPQVYPIDTSNDKNEALLKKLINDYVEEKYINDYKMDNFYKNKVDILLKEDLPVDVVSKLDNEIDDESYKKSSEKKEISLNDCIELLCKEEVLGEDDKWHCPKCKEFVRATKKFYLWSLPEILIIHLKRFSIKMDKKFARYGYGSREKLDTLVVYPEHIDLSEYVNGPNKYNCKYSLYAVSEHSGSLSFGHYTAKCKNFKNGNWYDFNDSSVSKCSGPHPSQYDYVLFYQRDKS